MGREVFVDSSALYALVYDGDLASKHVERVVPELVTEGRELIMTDYILAESLTLLKSRRGSRGADALMRLLENSNAMAILWIGEERFWPAMQFFRKHSDHGYSFTDCTSFVVMRELGIRDVLTTDHHFKEAGFRPLLPLTK